MSGLKECMKRDINAMFDDAGEDIVYHQQGRELSIVAIAEIGTNDTKKTPHNLDRSYGDASFTVKDSLETGITAPHSGDEIIYSGKKYTYVAIEQHVPGVIYRLRFLSGESAVKYSGIWG